MLHKWIIPIVLFIGLIVVFPLTALSQKTLRLDLKKGIGDVPLKSSFERVGGKLVKSIEFYNNEGVKRMTMNLWYDEKGRVIKTQNQGEWGMLLENAIAYYEFKDQTLTLTTYDIGTEELLNKVVCELNAQGTIVKEEDLLEDGSLPYMGGTISNYEYDETGQTLSLMYRFRDDKTSRVYTQTYDWECDEWLP